MIFQPWNWYFENFTASIVDFMVANIRLLYIWLDVCLQWTLAAHCTVHSTNNTMHIKTTCSRSPLDVIVLINWPSVLPSNFHGDNRFEGEDSKLSLISWQWRNGSKWGNSLTFETASITFDDKQSNDCICFNMILIDFTHKSLHILGAVVVVI